MSRLTRGAADRGAASIFLLAILSGGLFFALGALVVDMGRLYAEHDELQNGADAAAYAVAGSCAPDGCDIGTSPASAAGTMADDNSGDGTSDVTLVCGRDPSATLAECPLTSGSRADCAGAAPGTGPYVEVHTATRLPGGSTLFPPAFAGGLLGGDYQGTRVGACARAVWGPPRHAEVFGLAMSRCAWEQATGGGGSPQYAPPPPYSAGATDEQTISAHSGACDAQVPGVGNLAWLDGAGPPSCKVATAVGDTVAATAPEDWATVLGGSPCPLDTVFSGEFAGQGLMYVALYDSVQKRADGKYDVKIAGYAAFVPDSFALPGFDPAGSPIAAAGCGPAPCVSGFFTRGSLPGTVGTGGDFGLRAIQLVG